MLGLNYDKKYSSTYLLKLVSMWCTRSNATTMRIFMRSEAV